MKKKIFSVFFALMLVLTMSLVAAPVAADPGAGDVTIVVKDQAGAPIEGANVNLFWGAPVWDYMDGAYGRAVNPIPSKLTDVNGRATYSAADIASWRAVNDDPPIFQAKAIDSDGDYGTVSTWAVSDEDPCITYNTGTAYTFTYNLVMFEKVAPDVVWGTETVTVTYGLEDVTGSGLDPKMGFFHGPLTAHTTNPFQTYPKAGGGYDHYNMIDTNDDGVIDVDDYVAATLDSTSLSASVELKFFDGITDNIIAVPFLVKTPVTHTGLTETELTDAEDMYGVGSSVTVGLMTLSSESVRMTLDVPAPIISISVSPLSIDFGRLYAGTSSDPQSITVTNTSPIISEDITATVMNESRPLFYENNLTLDAFTIADWEILGLAPGASSVAPSVEAVLTVPGGTEVGTLTATLVFWAEEAL